MYMYDYVCNKMADSVSSGGGGGGGGTKSGKEVLISIGTCGCKWSCGVTVIMMIHVYLLH